MRQSHSVAQAGVHSHHLGSLQLPPLSSRDFPASSSQVAGITGMHQHIQLIFVVLVEMGFHHVGQAGLELLASSDPPASDSHQLSFKEIISLNISLLHVPFPEFFIT